ncbi:MAG: MFS transporter, partial [Alphaproteobacteria bacterium]|nr:MFS transporter [Alphaproteobacteria bacterium]
VPSVPWLASLALLGVGLAGAVAPYVTVVLRGADPRWPFVLSSATLMLAVFGLVAVERRLAGSGATPSGRPAAPRAAISPTERSAVFLVAIALLGLGFQVHSAMNSVPQFLRFAKPTDLDVLLPVFWIGFNVAMFPASALTKRWGGLMVMGLAGVIGGAATHIGAEAESLSALVTAQAVAGAAWGAMLMSAVSAALAIGHGGAEGRLVGTMWSALALATVARMGMVAGGVPGDPAYKPLLPFVPTAAWVISGAVLLVLFIVAGQRRPATA